MRRAGWATIVGTLLLFAPSAGSGAGSDNREIDVPAALQSEGRADLSQLWRAATVLERQGRDAERDHPEQAVECYRAAALLFENVSGERPAWSQPLWRSARMHWLAGDTLPLDAVDPRVEAFLLAEALSSRGIEVNPDCAECMLWKFAAMGRLRTTRGIWQGVRQLSDMAALLDRAIELEPSYADNEDNSTLGNLHYTSAVFYRIFPDWFWLGWLLGVKGDKDRALAHSQTALSIHPTRLDYQIELGSQLLCLGSDRDDPKRIREGSEVLRAAVLLEPETLDEVREIEAAHIMLAQPAKSCGYAGDAWVEIDRGDAMRAAKSARVAAPPPGP
ncbi:MAG: hypothetical protein O7A09_00530 [Proteobacteria bacterium]|nr:hypothetical protein [Pseudomonadota bacterium]